MRGDKFCRYFDWEILQSYNLLQFIQKVKIKELAQFLPSYHHMKSEVCQRTDLQAIQYATENTESHKTILWVDDEEMALEVWSQILQKLGYNILQARYGYEALEIFEKNKNKIALVILDLRMPGMNGCEVYDRLKEIRSGIKIIIVSGCIDQYYIDELLKHNFCDYIEKPFKLKELSEKIEEVLEQP